MTRTVLYWLALLIADWLWIAGALFVAGWALDTGGAALLLLLPCVILLGCRQHALGILGHEATHGLIHDNRLVNDWLGRVFCFWPIGMPFGGYRRFHLEHHRTVGTADDPEKTGHIKLVPDWEQPLRPWELARRIVLDFAGGAIPHLSKAANLTKPADFLDGVQAPLFLSAAVAVCWGLGCLWIPVLWFLSLGTAFWASFRLRIWTEHILAPGDSEPTQRVSMTWWQRFLIAPHWIGWHWEHHYLDFLKLRVPCWRLPAVRAATAGPPVISLRQLFRKLSHAAHGV